MKIDKLATNTPLDTLLNGGVENGVVTNLYGPPGSGKTNIVLCTALSCIDSGKMVVYIDTEGSFSLERFGQLGGNEIKLKKVVFLEPHEWKEQHEKVRKLERMLKDVGLIIIDSLVALYRLELSQENFPVINKQLATQYSILSKIARKYKIPVLVTNQVYSKDEKIELTSKAIAKYWSKVLIELKKTGANKRVAFIRKHRSMPEDKNIEFEIVKDGLKEIGKFNIF